MMLFERVRLIAEKLAGSHTRLAERLGLPQRTFAGYLNEKRQDNLWPILSQILSCFPTVSRDWLYFGEGQMLSQPVQSTQLVTRPQGPIRMVGLASCGVVGWNQIMPVAVSAAAPEVGEKAVAVIAFGESMVPAGISSGQVCYADPEQAPLQGDAVYVARRDGLATVKLYLGEGERAGWLRLKGWLDPDQDGQRKPFFVDMPQEQIETIAPVIYVRRRL